MGEIAKAIERQRAQVGLLLAKEFQHLALLASVNARRRPVLLPVGEPRILRLDGFKGASLQRRALRVPNCRFDSPFGSSLGLHVVRPMRHESSP